MLRSLLALFALALAAAAQLPPSATLSEHDAPLFRAEVARIESLLDTAADKPTAMYAMARTWASAKQWPETIAWLGKVARLGIDPLSDPLFTELRGTREFTQILEAVRAATPPVSQSSLAFTIAHGDLAPESIALDPRSGRFYLGSMRKGTILRCTASGACATFARNLGVVLGIKIRDGALWALSNTTTASALLHYNLATGHLVRRYAVNGSGHLFNDLAIAPSGDVYLTDTRAAAVWRLSGDILSRLPGTYEAANGIDLSTDGRILYVSTFPDGIRVVDPATGDSTPLARPAGLCLGAIDGLYFFNGALLAIQNGFVNPRILRLPLTSELRGVAVVEVLERRNPLFDGITTGVLTTDGLYYVANVQDNKRSAFHPLRVLKLDLSR